MMKEQYSYEMRSGDYTQKITVPTFIELLKVVELLNGSEKKKEAKPQKKKKSDLDAWGGVDLC